MEEAGIKRSVWSIVGLVVGFLLGWCTFAYLFTVAPIMSHGYERVVGEQLLNISLYSWLALPITIIPYLIVNKKPLKFIALMHSAVWIGSTFLVYYKIGP